LHGLFDQLPSAEEEQPDILVVGLLKMKLVSKVGKFFSSSKNDFKWQKALQLGIINMMQDKGVVKK